MVTEILNIIIEVLISVEPQGSCGGHTSEAGRGSALGCTSPVGDTELGSRKLDIRSSLGEWGTFSGG